MLLNVYKNQDNNAINMVAFCVEWCSLWRCL